MNTRILQNRPYSPVNIDGSFRSDPVDFIFRGRRNLWLYVSGSSYLFVIDGCSCNVHWLGFSFNQHFFVENAHRIIISSPVDFFTASIASNWSPTNLIRSSISFWYSFSLHDSPKPFFPPSRNHSFYLLNCATDTLCRLHSSAMFVSVNDLITIRSFCQTVNFSVMCITFHWKCEGDLRNPLWTPTCIPLTVYCLSYNCLNDRWFISVGTLLWILQEDVPL